MAIELDAGLPSLARDRVVRAGLWVIGGTLAAMLAWAELAPVSGAVVAGGEVRVSGERKTVQHLEGGIVAELRVRDGDVVQAGQVLLVLGDARVDASLDAIENEIIGERLTLARLESSVASEAVLANEAEQTVLPPPPPAKEVLEDLDPVADQAQIEERFTTLYDEALRLHGDALSDPEAKFAVLLSAVESGG